MGESAKTFRVSAPTPGQANKGRAPRPKPSRAGWLPGLAAVALILGASVEADAARVRGSVTGHQFLVNPVWEEGKDPERHLFSFREPVPTVRGEFRRLFPHIPKELCVAALAAEKVPTQKPVLIRVGGGRTTPVTIVVTPGAQLQFQNTDPFAHRLYGVGVGTFLAADTVKGGVRSWTVPNAGTFEIRDQSAPSLRMFVVAEPNVATIAYPSLRGEFAMNLEPGEYKIQAFFAGKKVGPEVPVSVAGKEIDLAKTPLKVGQENKNEKGN